MSASRSLMDPTQPWQSRPSIIKRNSNIHPFQNQHRYILWILFLIQFSTSGNLPSLLRSSVGRDNWICRPLFHLIYYNKPPHIAASSEPIIHSQLMSKRNKPTDTPTRGKNTDADDDKIQSPPKSKKFTGEQVMDEDQGAWPSLDETKAAEETEREKRAAEREAKKAAHAARIAEQKATGKKVRSKKDDAAEGEKEKDKPARGRSRSRDKAQQKRGVSKSSVRSASISLPTNNRRRSLSKPRKNRTSSVDSSHSRTPKSGGDSDDSKAGDKRKTPSSSKSAKFAADVKDNEGKTASTKKAAREKKKGDTYASKASKEKKTTWQYTTVVAFSMKVGKCKSTCGEVYGRHKQALSVLQTCDPECSIADHVNMKVKPIRSPGEFPKEGEHGRYQRHFTLNNEVDWSWDDTITDKNPRSFHGSFILLSDKEPGELFRYSRVDLRNQVKGEYKIKPIQELYTNMSHVILGMHGNCDSANVANDFRNMLTNAERDLFERKREYYMADEGIYEPAFDDLNDDWERIDFPAILGIRSYPKGGPYEKSTRGEDTSWKLAIHFEYAAKDTDRVYNAIAEFKRKGWVEKLFGDQALMEELITDPEDAAGKAAFVSLIPKHQNINRSVGNVFLPGVTNIDIEVAMYFEPHVEGKIREFKYKSLRDVLKKIYVKIGGHKIAVFQYFFRVRTGSYQAWFYDKVPEIRQFVETYSPQLPAYVWHRCLSWGWDEKTLKRLFEHIVWIPTRVWLQ